jgi:4-hydroxy-4-methyl-2-oxoglutarate aldolase
MSTTSKNKEHDWSLTTRAAPHPPISTHTIERARGISTATLHEAGGRIGALPYQIKPVAPGMKICGPALTIHSPGGDNLWLHRALALAKPADVLVVFASGAFEYGYWGEIMTTAAKARGLGGLIIDGCVRDADLLEKIGFPVFARGLSIRGTGKDYGAIGWINYPVLIGDISVAPGDLIVGDRDGVVAIPRERADSVVDKSIARDMDEAAICKRLEAGETTMQIYGFR